MVNRWILLFLILLEGIYLWRLGSETGDFTDKMSEGFTIRSAAAYLKDGITSHYGLPRILYGGTDPKYDPWHVKMDASGLVPENIRVGFPAKLATPDEWPYTHYPPGPNLVLAVLSRVSGLEHIWLLRLFPLATGIIALGLLFKKTAEVFDARTSIILALSICLIPTIPLALPALHYLSYSVTLLFLQMVVYLNWFGLEKVTSRSQAWLFTIGFLQGWLSFDFCFIVSLLVVPFWLLNRAQGQQPSFRLLAMGVIFPACGFVLAHVLHFFQVAAELEGIPAALAEFRNTAAERGGLSEGGYIANLGHALYFTLRNAFSLKNFNFGPFLFLAIVAAAPTALFVRFRFLITPFRASSRLEGTIEWPNNKRRILPALLAALLVSTIWIVVMPQHTAGNAHLTVRHLLVLYFFCVTTVGLSFRLERKPDRDQACVH